MKEEIIDVQWTLERVSYDIKLHYIVNWFMFTFALPIYIISYLYF